MKNYFCIEEGGCCDVEGVLRCLSRLFNAKIHCNLYISYISLGSTLEEEKDPWKERKTPVKERKTPVKERKVCPVRN